MWKRGKKDRDEVIKADKELKDLIARKLKERREMTLEEIKMIKSETQKWVHINRERRKGIVRGAEIKVEEWYR